jgi:Cu2+-containing amine oxidase
MSAIKGPQLYDIRFKNERIAYELSLQEIAVFYSGHNPMQAFANYLDSVGLIGFQAKGLVPVICTP